MRKCRTDRGPGPDTYSTHYQGHDLPLARQGDTDGAPDTHTRNGPAVQEETSMVETVEHTCMKILTHDPSLSRLEEPQDCMQ